MKQAAAKLLCMMIMVLIASCTTNTYYNEDADLLIELTNEIPSLS